MSYGSLYKNLSYSRSFDSEDRPYPIADDDLSDVLSKSDFAEPLLRKSKSELVQQVIVQRRIIRARMHQQAVSK